MVCSWLAFSRGNWAHRTEHHTISGPQRVFCRTGPTSCLQWPPIGPALCAPHKQRKYQGSPRPRLWFDWGLQSERGGFLFGISWRSIPIVVGRSASVPGKATPVIFTLVPDSPPILLQQRSRRRSFSSRPPIPVLLHGLSQMILACH